MKTLSLPALVCALGLLLSAQFSLRADNAPAPTGHIAEVQLAEAELSKNGVFGFPQEQAQILCDTPELRLSMWNNSEYLYAQAIFWNDNDAELGQLRDGRVTGDRANLVLDLDADEQLTKDVDRIYMLSPWPNFPGLRYSIAKGQDGKWATTPILSDTKGRGAIRYVLTPEGRRIRVDSFLIPLREINRKIGDKIRLVYYGNSPHPDLTVNSAGFQPQPPLGAHYADYNIPMASYHDYFLAKGGTFSMSSVPDGHHDAPSGPPAPPRRR
ncbi:hypothetical protein EV701_102110 [Chthoniobacter flavus]|uniref:hypothetical protein n=1 Tax=Chthoniobacter flavus TaxID=191863 RepID=UPI001050446F|nr:hypothetical protein [Chthoniobacter flavus]TCO94643.1 hypothetical protein EV701_102110 [Chthoniobacter flavus]